MKTQGVLFDFNGVIVDDYPLQKEAWGKVSLRLRNIDVTDKEMLKNIRGVQTKEVIKWMMKHPITEEEIALIAKEKENFVNNLYRTSPLFCLNIGLSNFFDELKDNNIPRTIATSSNLDDMHFSFDKLGLQNSP